MQHTLFSFADDRNYFENLTASMGVKEGPGWPDQFGLALQTWARKAVAEPIRTLSLFSGMGGLDISFHDAGFAIKEMVEIDDRFVKTLETNSGPTCYLEESQVHCMDIRSFLPSEGARFDFIIGGPPCQTFSAAARRASGVTGLNDERGTLFQEYVRLLRWLQPKGFLFENVYGITGANQGKAWQAIQREFSAAGYQVFSRILDAADYGVPQHRERMFIVGMKEGSYLFPAPTHGPDSLGGRLYYCAGEAVEGVALSKGERGARVKGRYEGFLEQIPPGLNYSFFTEKMGHPKPFFAWRSKFSDFLYKAAPHSPIRTLKAQAGQFTGPFHWENRPFSIGELKRLQTIPDAYEITGGRQAALHQIGNSVPPQVARVLALAVLEHVFGVVPPARMHYLEPRQTLGFRKRKRQLTMKYRATAQEAIEVLDAHQESNGSPERPRCIKRFLSDRFDWAESGDGKPIVVRVESYKEKWQIRVSAPEDHKRGGAYSITLTPAGGGWTLPVDQVRLLGVRYDPKLFTALWKAFEEELIRRHLKADLVQLCNYYQYDPAFIATFKSLQPIPSKEWEVVGQVCEGLGVRRTLPQSDLSAAWEVPVSEILSYAQFLRKLGYEVRNSNTNPEIPNSYYLIPYSFPTFNPKSVQLNKSLI